MSWIKGSGSLVHDGVTYEMNSMGVCQVPEHVVQLALDHGFKVVPAPKDQSWKAPRAVPAEVVKEAIQKTKIAKAALLKAEEPKT